jgi:hypothetical protein
VHCHKCLDTGVVLVEGPCDAVPLEAPCGCLAQRPVSAPVRTVTAELQIRPSGRFVRELS